MYIQYAYQTGLKSIFSHSGWRGVGILSMDRLLLYPAMPKEGGKGASAPPAIFQGGQSGQDMPSSIL